MDLLNPQLPIWKFLKASSFKRDQIKLSLLIAIVTLAALSVGYYLAPNIFGTVIVGFFILFFIFYAIPFGEDSSNSTLRAYKLGILLGSILTLLLFIGLIETSLLQL